MTADGAARGPEPSQAHTQPAPKSRPLSTGAERASLAPGRGPGAALARLSAAAGNRAVARTLARMQSGEGILAGGLVHPDIEAAITDAGGRGRSLDRDVAAQVGAAYGDSLSDVRVHDDSHAAALTSAVSARAFTVGRDIFFAAGEYAPGTSSGRELLGHELAHVVQQRGVPQSGPLTVSEPGDALEREAEAAARQLS